MMALRHGRYSIDSNSWRLGVNVYHFMTLAVIDQWVNLLYRPMMQYRQSKSVIRRLVSAFRLMMAVGCCFTRKPQSPHRLTLSKHSLCRSADFGAESFPCVVYFIRHVGECSQTCKLVLIIGNSHNSKSNCFRAWRSQARIRTCFASASVHAMQRQTRRWALHRVQTHAGHSISFNWNMFLYFVTMWPWPLTFCLTLNG